MLTETFNYERVDIPVTGRHLFLPPDYPADSRQALFSLDEPYFSSSNFLCGKTLQLLLVSMIAKRDYYLDPATRDFQVEFLDGDPAGYLYLPDGEDKNHTPWRQGYDFAVLKHGIGAGSSGIAYVSNLPAMFIIRRTDNDILALERILHSRRFDASYVSNYTGLDISTQQSICDCFSAYSDLQLLEFTLKSYGYEINVGSLPYTASTGSIAQQPTSLFSAA